MNAHGGCPAVLMLVLTACAGDEPGSRTAMKGDSIALAEVLRIGGLAGEMEYTFGSVAAVTVTPSGAVYVADGQGPVIRKYDANGTYLADVGRSGQGPGEISSVDGLAWSASGELVVWDGRNARVSYFGEDGAFLRSTPVLSGISGWRGFAASREGDAFVRVAPVDGLFETPEGLRADWARVTPDGRVERLTSAPPENREGPRYVLAGRGGYYFPFVTATLSAIAPDGSFYVGRNDVFQIRHIRPDGTESLIVREEPSVSVTREEKAEWEAHSELFAARNPEYRSRFFPIPNVKPHFRELVVDSDGRLWISRYTDAVFVEYSVAERADREKRGQTTAYQWRDRLRWDVFGPDDAYRGFVTLPFNTSFFGASGERVWGVQSGDYREDYVIVWRMVPQGG